MGAKLTAQSLKAELAPGLFLLCPTVKNIGKAIFPNSL
jgi:hypothetical protein